MNRSTSIEMYRSASIEMKCLEALILICLEALLWIGLEALQWILNKLFTKSYLKGRFAPVERKVQLSSTQERSTPGQAERHVKKRNIN